MEHSELAVCTTSHKEEQTTRGRMGKQVREAILSRCWLQRQLLGTEMAGTARPERMTQDYNARMRRDAILSFLLSNTHTRARTRTHTHTYGEITISIDPLDRLSPQRVSNSMFTAFGVGLCTPMSLFNSQH